MCAYAVCTKLWYEVTNVCLCCLHQIMLQSDKCVPMLSALNYVMKWQMCAYAVCTKLRYEVTNVCLCCLHQIMLQSDKCVPMLSAPNYVTKWQMCAYAVCAKLHANFFSGFHLSPVCALGMQINFKWPAFVYVNVHKKNIPRHPFDMFRQQGNLLHF
jgi:hypothetical protein